MNKANKLKEISDLFQKTLGNFTPEELDSALESISTAEKAVFFHFFINAALICAVSAEETMAQMVDEMGNQKVDLQFMKTIQDGVDGISRIFDEMEAFGKNLQGKSAPVKAVANN